MYYDLNYDENFENAINKILLDKNINISQYNNIFLYFPSTIIQRIFCKLSKRIKNFHVDIRILNTMDKHIQSALILLKRRGVTLLDAARLIRNALDAFSEDSGLLSDNTDGSP